MEKHKFTKDDIRYLENRTKIADELGIPNLWEIADQFGLYSGIQTIGTKLATYEILKRTINIPGHLIEFGTWKGSNLLFIAKVLKLLEPNSFKQIYAFDSFEGLQTFHEKDYLKSEGDFKGKYKGNENTLRRMLELYEMDSWIHIIKGDALKTIDEFNENNPHLMFSFAYIDFDLYAPVRKSLEYLQDKMVKGGIIVFDEALTDLWKGEGIALREFLDKNKNYKMKSISFARQPTLYIINS